MSRLLGCCGPAIAGALGAFSLSGADVVDVARSFLGVKYRHQGRSREGVDCIGLPVCVRAELGLPPMDAVGYAKRTVDSEMLDFCRANMVPVDRASLQPGDLLVQMTGQLRHIAIVGDYPGGGLSIIHAHLPNKKVVECRLDDVFMKSVRGCFRFPEVAA
ncbi:cell wall-associated NlpC family hydrolase [Variovorax sp. OAS795]|uniref:C40 family peptidase n=1 Tax=Variovorax sp. OAS795 TaxID=3034231 RepID=UPI00339608FB